MTTHLAWQNAARCTTADPELFFPVGTSGPTTHHANDQILAAKLICHSCPVRRECLEWALTEMLDHGIWGGQTEAERRASRRHHTRHRLL